MSADIEWKDPTPKPRRADRVAAQLRSRPGEWALIVRGEAPLALMSWWKPLASSEDFEIRSLPVDPDRPLGPRDVYCRAVPA